MFQVEYNGGKGCFDLDRHQYLFAGEKVRNEYQARFDPHRFVNLLNPSWSRPEYGSDKTNISFQLQNLSPYPVENIVVTVTIKDAGGAVKQKEFFEIKGVIQDGDTSSVYTVNPPKRSDESPMVTRSELEKMEKEDPKVNERILDSIERSLTRICWTNLNASHSAPMHCQTTGNCKNFTKKKGGQPPLCLEVPRLLWYSFIRSKSKFG